MLVSHLSFFIRYIASSSSAKENLKVKWKARQLSYAKHLIRLQTNVQMRTLKKGEYVYKEGDEGKSMFLVDDVDGGKSSHIVLHLYTNSDDFSLTVYLTLEMANEGKLDVLHDNVIVHSYVNGDSFGESSLMFTRPRS